VGLVGAGQFSGAFVPLFKAHPLVDEVILSDLVPEKRNAAAARFGIARTSPSLDALLETGVDAVAIITQPWLHGPQALQALRVGKHVYCAVPIGRTVDEVRDIVRAVEDTGLVYMTGETSYYYPSAIYCRERFRRGDFGHIVYGEGEYYHDWDHGLYTVNRNRGGERWRDHGGAPPMYYPTHSMSMIVSVTGAHATHVSCHGFVDRADDGVYGEQANAYGNVFSNQTALFKMSDGSAVRINEFRRIGHPGTVRLTLLGTAGSFEHNFAGAMWLTKDRKAAERLDDTLAVGGVKNAGDEFVGVSSVHPIQRLPREFAGLPNGHLGSHQFLVDDFVRACVERRQPPNNVWMAARYCVPGLIAHESARQGGALLEIPDFGAGTT
ncbi:MAG: Gfo/Idh/MocA family protein, partial [Chloroflexota bacterium]